MLGSVLSFYTDIFDGKHELDKVPTWMHLNLALWWLLTHDSEKNWFAISEIYKTVKNNDLQINSEVQKMYEDCKRKVYAKEAV